MREDGPITQALKKTIEQYGLTKVAGAFDMEFISTEDRLTIAVEALKFYADQGNWEDVWYDAGGDDGRSGDIAARIDFDDCEQLEDDEGPMLGVAGNRARTALKKIEG